MFKQKIIHTLVVATLCSSTLAAANWADRIQLKGFMTTAYQQTDSNTSFNGDGLAGITKDGAWNNTKLGLNLVIPVSNKITLSTQFLSILEGAENFNTHLDWAIMAYRLTDELQVRAGKIKFPTGMVNEYRDVGNSYPWISTPVLFYTTELVGPRNTIESYTGVSGLVEYYIGDTLLSIDIYGGEAEGEEMYLRKLMGAKLFLSWDDIINLQATYYTGKMARMGTMVPANGLTHSNLAFGMNFDWNDIIGYAEWSITDTQNKTTDGTSWYTTLGYQIDDWLPHVTYQALQRGEGSNDEHKQYMTTLGLRYDLFDNADLKFEYSYINTPTGAGLFDDAAFNPATDKNVNQFGVAFDLVF